MKQIGFSLDEIKENIDELSDDLFVRQKTKLIELINEIKEKIKQIDLMRNSINNGKLNLEGLEIKISTKKKGMIKNEKEYYN